MRLVSQGSGLWVSAQGRQWRLERQEAGGYILRSADGGPTGALMRWGVCRSGGSPGAMRYGSAMRRAGLRA